MLKELEKSSDREVWGIFKALGGGVRDNKGGCD